MDGILKDVLGVFVLLPRRGAETGGLLLGRKEASGVVIEDFAPVPSEHRFGRLYRLSDTDRSRLRESCDAIRNRQDGSQVIGLYRSNARDDSGVTEEDAEYLTELPEDRRILLLISPSLSRPSVASFCFSRDGRMEEPVEPAVFPFRGAEPSDDVEPVATESKPSAEISMDQTEVLALPVLSASPAAISRPVLPPASEAHSARRLYAAEPEQYRSSKLAWVAAVILLGAGTAITAGYIYSHRPIPPGTTGTLAIAPEVAQPQAPPIVAPPPVPVPQPETPSQAAPPATVEAPAEERAVNRLLDRWSQAIQRGQIEAAGKFYIPSARPAARARTRDLLGPARRLDILRLSALVITYPTPGEAIATFRQRWQSGVVRKSGGEQDVRMRLRATRGNWQIVTHQAETVRRW